MKATIISLLFLVTFVPFGSSASDSDCYSLKSLDFVSAKGSLVLCVESESGTSGWEMSKVTLRHQETGRAIFQIPNYALLSEGQCLDCNQKFYGMVYKDAANLPSELEAFLFGKMNPIHFDGKLDLVSNTEAGIVQIGTMKFHYTNGHAIKRTIASPTAMR